MYLKVHDRSWFVTSLNHRGHCPPKKILRVVIVAILNETTTCLRPANIETMRTILGARVGFSSTPPDSVCVGKVVSRAGCFRISMGVDCILEVESERGRDKLACLVKIIIFDFVTKWSNEILFWGVVRCPVRIWYGTIPRLV